MKKKHQNAKLLVLSFAMMLALYLIVTWRAIWACWEINQENFCTVDSQCISISPGITYEPNGTMYEVRIYCFTLEDGQVVSAYKDVVDDALSVNGVEDLDFLKNVPMRYTYIPEYIFSNDTYALLSISDSQGYVLAPEGMSSNFHHKVSSIFVIVPFAVFLLILRIIVAVIYWRMGLNWDGTKRRKRKKKTKCGDLK